LQGETIIFEVSQNAWHITCTDTPRVLQKLGDTWTPLRDERPTVTNDALAAHYLDGVYESACLEDSGCHVNACSAIAYDERLSNGIDDVLRLSAREYVQVGERQALTCSALDAGVESDAGADAGLRVVPEIERRAPTGPLIVRVLYFLDSACNTAPLTADVVVE
jgi:hypothetical protein